MKENRKSSPEFKINKYLNLKLEDRRTNIYIKGKLFSQCKFLLLSIPTNKLEKYEDIKSIDEAAEKLDSSLERRDVPYLTPETEFWGHCSNMQAWYENRYNTRLLHRNLAFPLLRALADAGDSLAKKVFKEEIAVRIESGYPSVFTYLINQNYLKYLSRRELDTILENPDFIKKLTDNARNLTNIPSWFYRKIKKFIPKPRKRALSKAVYHADYDATYKVVLIGDSGVPKTELTQRYLTNLFRSDTKMTIGVDFEVKSLLINNFKIKLQIWNFGGEERFRFLIPTYCRGANGVLFVYDAANSKSLAHFDEWLLVMRREMNREEMFPIIVVGLVPENEEERQVSGEEGINIAKSRGFDGFIECSTRTGENVEETFDALTRLMLHHSGYL